MWLIFKKFCLLLHGLIYMSLLLCRLILSYVNDLLQALVIICRWIYLCFTHYLASCLTGIHLQLIWVFFFKQIHALVPQELVQVVDVWGRIVELIDFLLQILDSVVFIFSKSAYLLFIVLRPQLELASFLTRVKLTDLLCKLVLHWYRVLITQSFSILTLAWLKWFPSIVVVQLHRVLHRLIWYFLLGLLVCFRGITDGLLKYINFTCFVLFLLILCHHSDYLLDLALNYWL